MTLFAQAVAALLLLANACRCLAFQTPCKPRPTLRCTSLPPPCSLRSEAVTRCKAEIQSILSDEETKEELECPAGIVGRIIGRGGETIRALQSASQVRTGCLELAGAGWAMCWEGC